MKPLNGFGIIINNDQYVLIVESDFRDARYTALSNKNLSDEQKAG